MEKSEAGDPIYRHNAQEDQEWQAPAEDSSVEAISDHIERYIGKIGQVFNEIIYYIVHIVGGGDERYHQLLASEFPQILGALPARVSDMARVWAHHPQWRSC